MNLSSLDRVELLGALEDRYQVDLSETGFAAVKTVGDLERMLQGKLSARAKYHYPAWVQRWPTTWNRHDSFITCCCVPRISCWDGRASRDGKICAAFGDLCW